MMDLEDYQEKIVYAKLLFMSGAWISQKDPTGGAKSSSDEIDAIFKTLNRFKFEDDYQHLVSIFDLATISKPQWNTWARDVAEFIPELKSLEPELSLELKQCIYDLAYSVAIRYRERNFLNMIWTGVVVSLKHFVSPPSKPVELGHFIKISDVEKEALNELARILRMTQRIMR